MVFISQADTVIARALVNLKAHCPGHAQHVLSAWSNRERTIAVGGVPKGRLDKGMILTVADDE